MNSKPLALADDSHDDDPRACLSALMDGDAASAQPACALWRDDEDARRRWHAYHLVGDVLRSEELASTPARDAAFLAGIRARLAAEPVLLAPAEPARRRQPWLVPVAAAAGFVVVAGVLVVARVGLPGAPDAATLVAVGAQRNAAVLAAQPAPLIMIRSAQLDEYVRLHEVTRGAVAVAAPGGTLVRPVMVPASPQR